MDSLIKLITLILAISLAGERLVTLIKTIIPWLAGDPNSTEPASTKREITRRSVVMVIAFLSCYLTASLVNQVDTGGVKSTDVLQNLSPVLLGLLASGGSAFWTSLLGYTKAARDIKIQQNQQEQVVTENVRANAETIRLDNRLNVAMSRLRKLSPPAFDNSDLLKINRI